MTRRTGPADPAVPGGGGTGSAVDGVAATPAVAPAVAGAATPAEPALLSVRDLVTSFPIRSTLLRRVTGRIEAVAGVSFDLPAGQTLGIVGESGSGKSTLARTIVGLARATAGSVLFGGTDLAAAPADEVRRRRRDIQMIFQDPYTSLNPGRTVRQLVTEAWQVHPDVVPRRRWAAELGELLERVGLDPDHADRYPHQFSGGQRQRIGIARALALRPRLVICDEPVSALDVSIQAQVLNLLRDLQRDLGLTYLFISHDLSVVRHVADRVAVLYLGRVVEEAPTAEIFAAPAHPYTRALLSAVPRLRPWREVAPEPVVLAGDLPSPANPPSGCRFRTRCAQAAEVCAAEVPDLVPRGTHPVACHLVPR
ncbi:ABC transporter ATP-binding protein [Actinocatenispora thailandica]|uniref:ABC transporter ATP-binding protein n=1 Tax=Actinocatenispora thailandica TaxID=227318 RepID=A0A7R7HZK8_9ACTN|nr:oligopeptide/dipeptide ABC transporter ATP-binding protein [Actinocatenispora thailandica]BCJ38452.1 ABC transporter ATP-binding protein [Actinocatenispora thailandica]